MNRQAAAAALRRVHRRAAEADAGQRSQGVQARRGRQLRDGLAELDRWLGSGVPRALRLRSAAVAAGADRPRRRQRRSIEPLPVGSAAAGGRSRCHRLRGRPARSLPTARAAAVAGELRSLGVPGRVPAIRRPVRPHRRRVLGHGRTRFDRMPRRLLRGQYLRHPARLGRSVHRRAAVPNRARRL